MARKANINIFEIEQSHNRWDNLPNRHILCDQVKSLGPGMDYILLSH